MGPLGPGKQCRSNIESGRTLAIPRFCQDLYALVTKEMNAGPPMIPATPVLPEERSRADDYWMQQYTDLPRLCCCPAIPLALLT
jgi:hypothetical protein